ncbi:MAG TPA: hypothetical protein VEN81_01810 [Planctomycetota bacterium]|nr:hypothetical protein [Planctomycetota bacterium]
MNALLALLSLLLFTPDVTKEDVKKLVAAGVSENAIVSFIRSHGPVSPLSSEDLIELRKAKVSERILATLLEMSRVPPGTPPVPPAEDYTTTAPTYTSPWYYPYGYFYGYAYGPYAGWYLGPGYYWRYPYWHRYPYGYPYRGYPYGDHWGPHWNYRYPTYVHPHVTPPRAPTVVPHSGSRGGGGRH